jgi:hypothetical protein
LMLGKLPGFRLPFMVTVTQFAVFSVGCVIRPKADARFG